MTTLVAPLTFRQRDILRLVADGLTDRQIGLRLGIHHDTARSHVSSIRTALGASNRAHAVWIAVQHGVLPVEGACP